MQVLRLIIMRYVCPAAVAALSILAASLMWGQAGAPGLVLTDLTVGQNLEGAASVSLTGPIPKAGLQITVTSSDPSRLLLAPMPDAAGSPSSLGGDFDGCGGCIIVVEGDPDALYLARWGVGNRRELHANTGTGG